MIIAGVWLLLLIMCSFVIYLFFPDLLHPETQETSEATTELFAMDTYITMTAYGPDAVIALTKATDKLTELEQLWSVTDVNSDIYAVNHSGGQAVSVSDETVDLANIMTVYAVYRYRAAEVMMIVFCRIFLAAVFSGNMMALVYSFAGSVLCLTGMLLLRKVIDKNHIWLASVFGAALHNIGQS